MAGAQQNCDVCTVYDGLCEAFTLCPQFSFVPVTGRIYQDTYSKSR